MRFLAGFDFSSKARLRDEFVLVYVKEVAGTPASSRASMLMAVIRRGIGDSLETACGGEKSESSGEICAVLAATKPAIAIREVGSAACRVLKISLVKWL